MNIILHFRGLAFIQQFTAKLSAAVKNTEDLFIETHEHKNSTTYFTVVPLKTLSLSLSLSLQICSLAIHNRNTRRASPLMVPRGF
jgi:hypothetical protein